MFLQLKSIILISTSILTLTTQASPYAYKNPSLKTDSKSIERRKNLISPIWSECAEDILKLLEANIPKLNDQEEDEEEAEEEEEKADGDQLKEKSFMTGSSTVGQTLLSGHRFNADIFRAADSGRPLDSLLSKSMVVDPSSRFSIGRGSMLFGGVAPQRHRSISQSNVGEFERPRETHLSCDLESSNSNADEFELPSVSLNADISFGISGSQQHEVDTVHTNSPAILTRTHSDNARAIEKESAFLTGGSGREVADEDALYFPSRGSNVFGELKQQDEVFIGGTDSSIVHDVNGVKVGGSSSQDDGEEENDDYLPPNQLTWARIDSARAIEKESATLTGGSGREVADEDALYFPSRGSNVFGELKQQVKESGRSFVEEVNDESSEHHEDDHEEVNGEFSSESSEHHEDDHEEVNGESSEHHEDDHEEVNDESSEHYEDDHEEVNGESSEHYEDDHEEVNGESSEHQEDDHEDESDKLSDGPSVEEVEEEEENSSESF